MAWISVDQKLIGGKLRTLRKALGCSRNEAVGLLVTLWLWGMDNADMDGLIKSADREDIAEVIRPGLSEGIDADTAVDKLIECGWIDESDGLYLHDWQEWRKDYNRYLKAQKSNRERQARYKENHKKNVSGNVTQNVSREKKPKKETVYDVFDRLTDTEIPLPDEVRAKMKEWLKYKSEKKQGYKETGLKTLLKGIKEQVDRHGERAVIERVDKSMKNNWAGIFFDDLNKKQGPSGNDYLESLIQGAG